MALLETRTNALFGRKEKNALPSQNATTTNNQFDDASDDEIDFEIPAASAPEKVVAAQTFPPLKFLTDPSGQATTKTTAGLAMTEDTSRKNKDKATEAPLPVTANEVEDDSYETANDMEEESYETANEMEEEEEDSYDYEAQKERNYALMLQGLQERILGDNCDDDDGNKSVGSRDSNSSCEEEEEVHRCSTRMQDADEIDISTRLENAAEKTDWGTWLVRSKTCLKSSELETVKEAGKTSSTKQDPPEERPQKRARTSVEISQKTSEVAKEQQPSAKNDDTPLPTKAKRTRVLQGPPVPWSTRFQELKTFQEKFGHVNPRSGHRLPDSNQTLYSWLANQRSLYQRGLHTHIEHVQQLRELGCTGFEGDIVGRPTKRKRSLWADRILDLKRFKEKFGHANPRRNVDGAKADADPSLYAWLSYQRGQYKKGVLTNMDQVQELREMGCRGFGELGGCHPKKQSTTTTPNENGETSVATSAIVTPPSKTNYRQSSASNNSHVVKNNSHKGTALTVAGPSSPLTQTQHDSSPSAMGRPRAAMDPPAWVSLSPPTASRTVQEARNFIQGECNVSLAKSMERLTRNGNDATTAAAVKRTVAQSPENNQATCAHESQTSVPWRARYEELVGFKSRFGHLNFLNVHGHEHLASWLSLQRTDFRNGVNLSTEQIKLLRSVGCRGFDPSQKRTSTWKLRIQELKEFQMKFGHVNPRLLGAPESERQLAAWLAKERVSYSRGTNIPSRIQMLRNMGCFGFEDSHSQMQRKHASDDSNLGATTTQDRQKVPLDPPAHSSSDRAETQKDIKQPANNTMPWASRFKQLEAYKMQHGHGNPPRSIGSADFDLAVWLSGQRRQFRRRKLSMEKHKKFLELGCTGFSENDSEEQRRKVPWTTSFMELKRFKMEFGHANPTPGKPTPPEYHQLGRWLCLQRSESRRGVQVTKEQVRQLIDLGCSGFDNVDDLGEESTNEGGMEPEQVVSGETDGHASEQSTKLSTTKAQAETHSNNSDGTSQEKKSLDAPFETRYLELKAYKDEHGHANPTQSKKGPSTKLGFWLSDCRRKFRTGVLSDDEVEKLRDLGCTGFGIDGGKATRHEESKEEASATKGDDGGDSQSVRIDAEKDDKNTNQATSGKGGNDGSSGSADAAKGQPRRSGRSSTSKRRFGIEDYNFY